MNTLILKPDGTKSTITHPKRLDLATLQTLVGGYIQLTGYIPAHKTGEQSLPMIVNEDGFSKALPFNAEATRRHNRHTPIVGVALVLLDWRFK